MVGLIILNVLAVILESVPSIFEPFEMEFYIFDFVSIIIFTIEYIVRMWASINGSLMGS